MCLSTLFIQNSEIRSSQFANGQLSAPIQKYRSSFCGLFGFSPTLTRVPFNGAFPVLCSRECHCFFRPCFQIPLLEHKYVKFSTEFCEVFGNFIALNL